MLVTAYAAQETLWASSPSDLVRIDEGAVSRRSLIVPRGTQSTGRLRSVARPTRSATAVPVAFGRTTAPGHAGRLSREHRFDGTKPKSTSSELQELVEDADAGLSPPDADSAGGKVLQRDPSARL